MYNIQSTIFNTMESPNTVNEPSAPNRIIQPISISYNNETVQYTHNNALSLPPTYEESISNLQSDASYSYNNLYNNRPNNVYVIGGNTAFDTSTDISVQTGGSGERYCMLKLQVLRYVFIRPSMC